MLDTYMNTSVVWGSKSGVNEYGEANYIEREIECRLVEKIKEITNDKGDKVIANSVIQCTDQIKVGDTINGKRIEVVNSMTMLDNIAGYRGYLL